MLVVGVHSQYRLVITIGSTELAGRALHSAIASARRGIGLAGAEVTHDAALIPA